MKAKDLVSKFGLDKTGDELLKALTPIGKFLKKHKIKIILLTIAYLVITWMVSEGEEE